mgnify:FL=1
MQYTQQAAAVTAEVNKAVQGKQQTVNTIWMAMLAGGHVLIEDIPGVGKTTLALAFARALGEYGATSMIAGYTPGKTATIATTVYQLWRTNDEAGAMRWVLVDIVISAVVLLAVNLLEKKQKAGGRA